MDLNKLSINTIALLPLLYICWKDRVLSPSELGQLRTKVADASQLSDHEKDFLIQNLNPQNPPSDEVLKEWLVLLRKNATSIKLYQKESIFDLVIKLAKINTNGSHESDNFEIIDQIKDLSHSMGLELESQYPSLLQSLGIEVKKEERERNFDIHKMSKIIDEKFYATKQSVKTLMKDHYFDDPSHVDKDVYRLHVLDVVKKFAEQGFGALAYEKQYGGKNDMGGYISVFETLCYYNLNYGVKLGVQFGLFGGSVYQLGTTYHHEKYMTDIGKAKLLGCFAMTETGHGSNVKDLETTAVYNHEKKSIVVHSPTFTSGKEYIGNALHGRLAVVFAQLIVEGVNHGVHAVLVPYKDNVGNALSGIRVEDCGYKLGLNGIDNGRIWFTNVAVPKENLLNRFGDIDENGKYISKIENPNKRFFTMLGALVGGRICVGLGATSAAKTALGIALKYAHRRRQFAPDDFQEETLLIDYPSHQHRLMPLLAKSIVFHNALSNLAEQFAKGDLSDNDARKIETKAAGLKALATWHCTKAIQESREACGGKGYLKENRLADLKADSDIFTTFEGDNNVLLQLVAKGILTEFKQNFSDDGFLSAMRYIGGKIGFTLAELNVYKSRNTNEDHLMSEDFLSEALRYREKKMVVSLADRMRNYISSKKSPHQAFLLSQVHMIDAAKAYVERLAYREMLKRISALPESKEKKVFEKINTFYALTIIMENRYFFLESDYMDGSKTKAVRKLYSVLMKEIKEMSIDIVDSFGLPEELLEIKK